MKLISSEPKSRHKSSQHKLSLHPPRGWFLTRFFKPLRRHLFSTRAAWWVLVAVVATFAIMVFRMLRHALEAGLQ